MKMKKLIEYIEPVDIVITIALAALFIEYLVM